MGRGAQERRIHGGSGGRHARDVQVPAQYGHRPQGVPEPHHVIYIPIFFIEALCLCASHTQVTHVYPRIDPAAAAALNAGEASEAALSPAALITFSEMPTFQRMIASKTPSLHQRRRALEVLKEARAGLAASEAKLANLEALTEAEQHNYDTLDATALEEKQQWLSKQMEVMVDKGQLTAAEKETVLAQLATKLEQLEGQLASAEAEGKTKRADKLRSVLDELRVRCAAASEVKPIKRAAKFEAEIKNAQKKLAELEKIEKTNGVLPLAEVQKLAAKPKLLEDLAAMQAESRGWFSEAAVAIS